MQLAPRYLLQRWGLGVLVFALAIGYFSLHLADEPYFLDEGAYIAESYFYRLMKEGRWNDVDWFHLASFDHLQVGRLMVGAMLDLHGFELPTSLHDMDRWYGVDGTPDPNIGKHDGPRLFAARIPMLVGAAVGCWGAFVIGKQLIGPLTGILAACALAASPLYATHARRAMPDDWVIAFGMIGLITLFFLGKRVPYYRGRRFLLTRLFPAIGIMGASFGLSVATKLSGLSMMIGVLFGTAIILAAATPWRKIGPNHTAAKWWGSTVILSSFLALAVFVGIHPFFYAQPLLPADTNGPAVLVDGQLRNADWINNVARPLAQADVFERLRYMVRYRQSVLDDKNIQQRFASDALPTTSSRFVALLRDGWGRHSFAAQWGLSPQVAWWPAAILILLGWIWCVSEGFRAWRMGLVPITWLIATWWLVEGTILTRELTLNWDRYYMGWVAASSVLAAVGLTGPASALSRKLVLLPPVPQEEPGP